MNIRQDRKKTFEIFFGKVTYTKEFIPNYL